MNITIVGCGKIGQKIIEKLSAENEYNITVIDCRHEIVNELVNKFDVMGIVGDCINAEILEEADVENSDILIACTGSDEINFTTCLIAKKIGNCQTIARIRKPEYGKTVNLFKNDLGLEMVINANMSAAREISRILKFPGAIQIDTFAKGKVEILKFKLPEHSVLCNLKLSEIVHKVSNEVLICGVERGGEAFIPGGDFVLKSGDLISVVGAFSNHGVFFKKIGVSMGKVKNVIILGGGTTGFYLASMLIKAGMDVKIIEKNTQRCESLSNLLPKATIINGDATDNNLLLEESVESSDAVVALTNSDEENILISLFTRSVSSGKIVTKINRIDYNEVIKKLDLDSIVYPRDISAEDILRFVRAKNNSFGSSNVETIHFILDGKAEALEFIIKDNCPLVGKKLSELKIKSNILIAFINRKGKVITPRGYDCIEADDTVIVVTTIKGLKDIKDILKG